MAPLIGEAIKRIHRGESVGALFSSEVSFTQEMILWEDGVARTLDVRGDGGEPGADGPPDDGPGGGDREGEQPDERDRSPTAATELASSRPGDR